MTEELLATVFASCGEVTGCSLFPFCYLILGILVFTVSLASSCVFFNRLLTVESVVIPTPFFILPLSNSLMKVQFQAQDHISWMHFVLDMISNLLRATEGARSSLNLSGTVLGFYPVRVLPSKTAIAPVNPDFLPRVRIVLTVLIVIHQLYYIIIRCYDAINSFQFILNWFSCVLLFLVG